MTCLRLYGLLLLAGFFGSTFPAWAFKPPAHEHLPNFDKRRDQPEQKAENAGKAARQASKAAAKTKLAQQVPRLEVDWDDIAGSPRKIGSTKGFLTGRKGDGKGGSKAKLAAQDPQDRHRVVKAFLNEHSDLFGHGSILLNEAQLEREAVTPHNGMRTVVWRQQVDNIPVFEAVMTAHLTRDDELVSISSQFVADPGQAANAGRGNRAGPRSQPGLTARRAIVLAARAIDELLGEEGVTSVDAAAEGPKRRQRFRAGNLPGQAAVELAWLPMSAEELRLCWQVELVRRAGGELYRVLLDAQSGEVLLRHCRTFYLSDVSYRVFTSDSPAPMSPGLSVPGTNQAPLVSRSLVTLSALRTNASPVGWIADGDNEPRGNNVDAHSDTDADNLPDLPRPHGSPARVFDFPLDLTQGPETYRDAAVVQLFYWCNWMHDQLYDLGFTEAAGNFQKDNFGRGGRENDPVLADAQDGSGLNNANFSPTADGNSPRIQMFVFDGPNPDRDGDLDAEIILHEYTHGLTDRLVGGGIGIFQLQTYGMGEGWSDFYALAILSEEADNIDGAYAMGGYMTYQFFDLQENYYYGIRRYPYSTDLGINPLTFKDIDPTQAIGHTGVPMSPRRRFDPLDAPEVHRQGEVWCVALWELRANLIRKYGFATGNRLTLQLVTDGLKLSPPNPNFVQARDAILQADLVNSGGANQVELWAGFAKRGLGVGASAPPVWTTTGVRESYDIPDPLVVLPATTLVFGGPVQGPLSPLCRSFLLTNSADTALEWNVSEPPVWLTLSPIEGTLAPGATVTVSVCLNGAANNFPTGLQSVALNFSNVTSQAVVSRLVQLRITGLAGMPFLEDFEAGLAPHWAVTGSGFFLTQVSTDSEPHGGAQHLIMQSQAGGYPARNELTLALDLEGYTNVMLRFWAKEFNDEPDGPPPIPFLDNANFDGLAISGDGLYWYEVRGLRGLHAAYSDVVVDLDSAVTQHGLVYNSAFRLRFNQYGNAPIPDDGLALDDIAVTGFAPRRFSLSLPAFARETDGVLTNAGVIRLPNNLTASLTIHLSSSDPLALQVPTTVVMSAGTNEVRFAVTIVDDLLLDGSQRVEVVVSASGYISGVSDLPIHDNETATLLLSVPATVREGDGALPSQGRVECSRAPSTDIAVTLTSSHPAEVQVPSMVVIAAGQTLAVFNITVADDGRIDGPQNVLIGAHVENWVDDFDVVSVLDNEAISLSLSVPSLAIESVGQLVGAANVRIAGTLETNLVVSLSSSDPAQMSVQPVVAILAGQTFATFPLNMIDDPWLDGVQLVTVDASAPGFGAVSGTIRVHDNEAPALPFDPSPPDRSTNNSTRSTLSWRFGLPELIVNGGFETGDFTGWFRENTGAGGFVVADSTFDPSGPQEPVPPLAGQYCAVAQQSSPGRRVLYQDLTIPLQVESAVLNWRDWISNGATEFSSNHAFRVEIRSVNDDLLATAFFTEPGSVTPREWIERSFSLTPYRGQTIRVAFVEEDSLGFLNVFLDEVRIMIRFPGAMVSEVYFSTNSSLSAQDLIAATTNTSWTLPTLAAHQTYYWQVATRRGNERVYGAPWRFTTRGVGAVHDFIWSPVPSPQTYGQPFPVTLRARDSLGQTVTNFTGLVNLRAERRLTSPPVRMLTFVGYTDTTTEYRGTRAAISASFTNYVETVTSSQDLAALQALLADKDVFLIPEQEGASKQTLADLGAAWSILLSNFVYTGGTLIVCSYQKDEHLLLAHSDLLHLEKLGSDRNMALISNSSHPLAAGLPAQFAGFQVARYAPIADVAVRTADGTAAVVISQNVGAGRAIMIGTDYNFVRTGMDGVVANAVKLPLPSVVQPIALEPTFSGYLIRGAWTGLVTVSDVGSDIVLIADDGAGHGATSVPFTVGGINDLGVSVVGSPGLVSIGGEINYEVVVTNSGPGAVAGVVLDNVIGSGLELLAAGSSRGSCAAVGGGVSCQIGILPGGETARITLYTRGIQAGMPQVQASVSGAPGEIYLLNNTAAAVTTVSAPSIYISDGIVPEADVGSNEAYLTVSLSPASSQTVSCDFTTVDSFAVAGEDYVPLAGRVVFLPGITNQLIFVTTLGDILYEGHETFHVVLSHPTNATVIDPQGGISILENDSPPLLTVDDVTVLEGNAGEITNAVVKFSLSAPSGRETSVQYTVVDGSAHAVTDFIAAAGSVRFLPGQTNQTVILTVNGDDTSESNEVFRLLLSNHQGASLVRTEAVITIEDNDRGRVERFVWGPVGEAQRYGIPFPVTITAVDGTGQVVPNFQGPVRLLGFQSPQELTIGPGSGNAEYPMGTYYHDQRLQVIYLADELGGARRLTSLALNIAVPPGQTLRNWTIRAQHTQLAHYTSPAWEGEGWTKLHQKDQIIAEPGWVVFRFESPFEYNGLDNLMVDFSFNNASFTSDGQCYFVGTSAPRALHFRTDSGFGDPLNWSGNQAPPPISVSQVPAVRFNTELSVAITPANSGNFVDGTWAGLISAQQVGRDIVLRAEDDAEHFGSSAPFTVDVVNDLDLQVVPSTATVGIGGLIVYTATITNSGLASTAVRCAHSWPPGAEFISATTSQGGCLRDGTTVVCDLGTLSSAATGVVSVVLRALESGELVNHLTVSRGEPETYLRNNAVTIITMVTPPSVFLDNTSVTEGNSGTTAALVGAHLSHASSRLITVDYFCANLSASNAFDYLAVAGQLVFAPGVTNLSFSVPVLSDFTDETNEVFGVRLRNPTNVVVGTTEATVTIMDDDLPPSVTIDDFTVVEGDSGTTVGIFRANLSLPSEQLLWVSYSTSNGTAQAGSDYQTKSGLLLFPPRLPTRIIPVLINTDSLLEGDEMLSVSLFNPVNVTIARARAQGNILNDDGLIGVVDHFEWGNIVSPQNVDVPIAVSVTAKDSGNNTIESFAGTVRVEGRVGDADRSVGNGSSTWKFPLACGYEDARSTVIYLASELGGRRPLIGISFDVTTTPGQPLHNFTIRVKHTPRTGYAIGVWESNDWVQVFRGDVVVGSNGWTRFPFTTPFDYNGQENIMIDFCIDHTYFTTDGLVRGATTGGFRAIGNQTDSQYGDPRLWNEQGPPVPQPWGFLPNTRFHFGSSIPVQPTFLGNFVNGVWRGSLVVTQELTNLVLRVDDDDGSVGVSAPFDLVSATDTDRDGLDDAWEMDHFGSLQSVQGTPQGDPDADGMSNYEEFVAGTDPRDGGSGLELLSVKLVGEGVHVTFRSVSGRTYRLERAARLSGPWVGAVHPIAGTGQPVDVVHVGGALASEGFYRVVVVP